MSALRGSKRPLVVIGLGVDPANAAPIRRWLTEWNLPVAVTPKVKGIVDETSASFVGVAGGMAADGVVCDAIAAADLVVGFGLDPVEIDKTWHAERPIHWLLESPNACGIVPAGAALVSHRALLDALADERPPAAWPAAVQGVSGQADADADRSHAVGRARCGPATSSQPWRR